jgi:quinol monooxygenase YgiN
MATMTTVLCLCRVGDFVAWRPQFERDVAAETGVQSYRIWRSQDDPNLVAVIETRESRDAAEAVWSSPQAREAMERHGVDLSSLQIQYFDEVAAETR